MVGGLHCSGMELANLSVGDFNAGRGNADVDINPARLVGA